MPTHADLAAKLLVDSSTFFQTLAEQNPSLKPQMDENSQVFEQMAILLSQDPSGETNGQSYGELAGRLLKDAATFFRSLAEQNEPLKEQMNENADVFEQIAGLVAENPLGEAD